MNLTNVVEIAERVQSSYLFALTGKRTPPEMLAIAQKETLEETARVIFENPSITVEDLHAQWVNSLGAKGYVLGPEINDETKQHPGMLPYDHLPKDSRVATVLFLDTVRALAPFCDAAESNDTEDDTDNDNGKDEGDETAKK